MKKKRNKHSAKKDAKEQLPAESLEGVHQRTKGKKKDTTKDVLELNDSQKEGSFPMVSRKASDVRDEDASEPLDKSNRKQKTFQWWKNVVWSGDRKRDIFVQCLVIAVASALYLTGLDFGLWDCWEPHYAETARMMIVRNDWLHPYWSYAYFLSKPILMFWYMAGSMWIFGVTEWAIRLPFALHAVFLVWSIYFIVSRLYTVRSGILSALIVGTMPLSVFLGRQAMSDILVTTYLTAGLGCFALAVFGDRQEREQAKQEQREVSLHVPYLYCFYVLIGLSLLAKGFLGAGLAGLAILGYLFVSNDWSLLARVRLVSGCALTFLIAAPWYIHMCFFEGRNIDDHKTFIERFLFHDNVRRVFGGVHGEKGHFVYFLRQLGYALGSWVGFLPLSLFSFGRFRSQCDGEEKLRRFLFSWWVFSVLFFSFSQTKFHHYIYPVVPISGILIGVWLDRYLIRDDANQYRVGLLFVLAVFGLVFRDIIQDPQHLVNLFVYKYSRPYPWEDPMLLGGINWSIQWPFLTLIFRPTPQIVLRDLALFMVFLLCIGFFYNHRKAVVWGSCLVGLLLSFYLSHSFMPNLTRHWSQKEIAEVLKKESVLWEKLLHEPLSDARQLPVPKEPLFAYKMNWRGEKFYFRNFDIQIIGTNAYSRMWDALKRHRKDGRPVYFLIEADRIKKLKRALGTYETKRLKVMYDKNNKYKLLKLLPKPSTEVQKDAILQSDIRSRTRYDNWAKKWRKENRRKKRNKRHVNWQKYGMTSSNKRDL